MRMVAIAVIAFFAGVAVFDNAVPREIPIGLLAPDHGVESIYEHRFETEAAVLEVLGDPGANLDVYVYDSAGALVLIGTGVTAHTRVIFTPRVAGVHRIVVRHSRPVADDYC
mgnify:CR=1 FL=1